MMRPWREHEEIHLLAEIRDLLQSILARLTPPATIVLLDTEGNPMSTLSLTGTASDTVDIAVGDASGNPIPGDVLDPSSGAVSVVDPTICTAILSADQTNIVVTALDVTGSTTVSVAGTCQGIALTDFGGPLAVNTTASAPVPATIILTPQGAQGAVAPAPADPNANLVPDSEAAAPA